ncbi:MAG: DUF4403 family protein [Bacteroidetes bacterium]|nr:DUF4403 family protein [Bacteroidota bacterium]
MKKVTIHFNIIILLLLLGFLYSCSSLKITRPEEAYVAPNYTPKPSVINLPLYINIADLQNSINKKFTGLIYEDNSFEDNDNDNVMVKAWKKEDFTLNYENNQLSYRIPLKLWIKAGFKKELLGISVSDYREINAEIALKFKSTFYINPDWTISTFTNSDGFEWLSTPVIKVGPIDIPIKFIAGSILKKNQGTISSEIDKAIKQNFSMRKYIQDVWISLQKPIKINNEYNIWLKLNPQEISSTPILSQNGKIKISIGIKSLIESYMGSEPPASKNTGLPDYKMVKTMDNNFNINLLADISYKTADTLAKQFLKGKTFTQDKKTVTVTDIKVYGSNNKMIIATTLIGSLNATIYFTGKPVYDSANATVRIVDIDFELQTRNALIKTANWLLHNKLIRMIEPSLVFPIGDKLAESKRLIQQKLSNNYITKNVLLNGQILDLYIDNIFLTPESIKVAVNFKGNLNLSFEAKD